MTASINSGALRLSGAGMLRPAQNPIPARLIEWNYGYGYNKLFHCRQAEPEPGEALFELDSRVQSWYG
jgi:hypothetical protein